MKSWTARLATLLVAVGFIGLANGWAWGHKHAPKPAFRFAGGTVSLPGGCAGKLEMNSSSMTFKCTGASVEIPYSAILFMQYRPDISPKVRGMKLHWKVKPQSFFSWFGGKNNRYFTIVYQQDNQRPAETLVLEVSPDDMRPYLAEFDLKVGQRVEVENMDDFN